MTTSAQLPVTAGQPQDIRRHALITETSRLAFEIEAAERRPGSELALAELRMAFHEQMAELLGITPGWCPEAAEVVARTRRGHLDRLSEWRATLDRLRAQEG